MLLSSAFVILDGTSLVSAKKRPLPTKLASCPFFTSDAEGKAWQRFNENIIEIKKNVFRGKEIHKNPLIFP